MTPSLRARASLLAGAVLACALVLALTGCSGDGGGGGGSTTTTTQTTGNSDGFVSDNPDGSGSHYSSSGSGSSSSSASSGGAWAPSTLAEADILALDGGRLYALSSVSGLSIVDVATKDALSLLGRYQAQGSAFEMFVRGTTAYVLYQDWQRVVCTTYGACHTERWSHLEAIDVEDAAHPTLLASVDLVGTLQEARLVGDVLFAVTEESGNCWGCTGGLRTVVTSLDVSDPAAFAVIDALPLPPPMGGYPASIGHSVAMGDGRMYVAGVAWNGYSTGEGTIDAVDISDPAGHLAAGAHLVIKGEIESPFQLDEHAGVLRAISQPGLWLATDVPTVQTWQVTSATSITPLAEQPLALPASTRLRAVRLDGARAFAVPDQPSAPLITLDLTDPAQPEQLGSLALPGPVAHLEPRGDRLFSLAYPPGSASLSLLDVADLAHPALITTAPFGASALSSGDAARIQKALQIDEASGTVLVPYLGLDPSAACETYRGGVQILDFTPSSLTARGVADLGGQSQRAFTRDGRLFTFSSAVGLRTFDIADRDAPLAKAALPIAANVQTSAVVGASLARLGKDWITGSARLEVVSLADPERPDPIAVLDLSTLDGGVAECGGWGFWDARLFASGDLVFLVRHEYAYPAQTTNRVAVIDLSNPAAPALRGATSFQTHDTYYDFEFDSDGEPLWAGGAAAVVGHALVFLDLIPAGTDGGSSSSSSSSSGGSSSSSSSSSSGSGTNDGLEHAAFEVIDFSDPDHLAHHSVPLAPGFGHTALIAAGTRARSSHWAPHPSDPGKVVFTLDELDFAGSSTPALTTVAIPGSLLASDAATGRALTVSYQREVQTLTWEDCLSTFGPRASFAGPETPGGPPDTCSILHRTAHAVEIAGGQATILDSLPLDDATTFRHATLGDDRVFIPGRDVAGQKISVIGGLGAADLRVVDVPLGANAGMSPEGAIGKKLVLQSYQERTVGVLDAASLDALQIAKVGDLRAGFLLRGATLHGDQAFFSQGMYGLQVVELSP